MVLLEISKKRETFFVTEAHTYTHVKKNRLGGKVSICSLVSIILI